MLNNRNVIEKKYDIITEDGHSFKINLYKKNDLSPVIVCFPAMGVNAAYYTLFAKKFAERGFCIVTSDLRGIGTSSIRASKKKNFGYFEMINYDWPAVIDKIKDIIPKNKIFLLGHSLGGQLTSLYLSLQRKKEVEGLILITTNSVYYKGYRFPDNIKVLIGINLAYIISLFLGYLPGHRFGFGGLEAKNVIKDWSHQGRTGRYEVLNSKHNFDELLTRIELPVISFSFEGDFYAPASAVQHLSGKMKGAKITSIHIEPEKFNLRRKYHFSWARKPDFLITMIQEWINSI